MTTIPFLSKPVLKLITKVLSVEGALTNIKHEEHIDNVIKDNHGAFRMGAEAEMERNLDWLDHDEEET